VTISGVDSSNSDEQAQVDYGQLQVRVGEQRETVHLFVFTLGYSWHFLHV
jgi:hypothetical protein